MRTPFLTQLNPSRPPPLVYPQGLPGMRESRLRLADRVPSVFRREAGRGGRGGRQIRRCPSPRRRRDAAAAGAEAPRRLGLPVVPVSQLCEPPGVLQVPGAPTDRRAEFRPRKRRPLRGWRWMGRRGRGRGRRWRRWWGLGERDHGHGGWRPLIERHEGGGKRVVNRYEGGAFGSHGR